jgi:hypothetical protein
MTRNLKVVVRLLAEPCLWGWEIRDTGDGSLVESSWSSRWMAFERREDARADGLQRLAELICPGGRVDRAVAHRTDSETQAAVSPAA